MSHRYFVEPPISSTRARVIGAEAHHLLHVMRGKRGDIVELFDGTGVEFRAEISSSGRDWVECAVVSSETVDRELAGEIDLAVALPKGERQRVLVEKLVELGVSSLVPLATSRCVSQFSDQVRVRMERHVIEASKQCGRNRLLRIGQPTTCESYFSTASHSTKLIAQPGGQLESNISWSHKVTIAIGPEGGFTTQEIDLAMEHGWQKLNLGTRILRIETAAMFASAIASVRMNAEGQVIGAPTPRIQTT